VSEENSSLALRPSSGDIGKRLDAFLAENVEGWSRARLGRLIDEGDVLVNGSGSKASYKVRENDEIKVELAEIPTACFEPENIPLDIVFEDDYLAVINKPAGMVVHPGAGVNSGTLANAIAWHFGSQGSPPYQGGVADASADGVVLFSEKERAIAGTPNYDRVGLVHRLDKDTSGIIGVANNEEVH